MARSLDPDQQRELTEFVNELFDRSGYKTTAQWARDSGYPAPNLSNLRNGKGAIDGFNLLRLIRAAAEMNGGDPAGKALRATPTLAQQLEDLTGKVDRLLEIRRSQGARRQPFSDVAEQPEVQE